MRNLIKWLLFKSYHLAPKVNLEHRVKRRSRNGPEEAEVGNEVCECHCSFLVVSLEVLVRQPHHFEETDEEFSIHVVVLRFCFQTKNDGNVPLLLIQFINPRCLSVDLVD